jgi:hypothetical protein
MAPTTAARLKKRIVRTVIHESVADLTAEIVLTVHQALSAFIATRSWRRRDGRSP